MQRSNEHATNPHIINKIIYSPLIKTNFFSVGDGDILGLDSSDMVFSPMVLIQKIICQLLTIFTAKFTLLVIKLVL